MLGKCEFKWFFHRLMISEKNINKNNVKWLTTSCILICCSSIFTKKACVLTEICCVLLVFIFPDLVWSRWHNYSQMFTNIPCHFCLILKLFTLGNNIQLRFASLNINYLGRIISDIIQKGMEHLLTIISSRLH